MRVGVVTFPGSLDDADARRAVARAGHEPVALWHDDADLRGAEAVILPGGFSWGDYLRCGAIAHRATIMREVEALAEAGGPVLGICNGFQILCEAGLLPGALLANASRRFVCRAVDVRVERADTPWTRAYRQGQSLLIPIKNGEGRYYADADTLDTLEAEGRVVARYAGANPNGSERDIAGVCSARGNVVGLMPHPEHAVDATLVGGEDGLGFFEGLAAGQPA